MVLVLGDWNWIYVALYLCPVRARIAKSRYRWDCYRSCVLSGEVGGLKGGGLMRTRNPATRVAFRERSGEGTALDPRGMVDPMHR
jgi:hypothetical protein